MLIHTRHVSHGTQVPLETTRAPTAVLGFHSNVSKTAQGRSRIHVLLGERITESNAYVVIATEVTLESKRVALLLDIRHGHLILGGDFQILGLGFFIMTYDNMNPSECLDF